MPIMFPSGRSRSQANSSIILVGHRERLLERPVELRGEGHHARRPDLGDQLLAVLLPLGLERRLQLLEAALAQGAIGRPVGLVEGPARRRRWLAACPRPTASATSPSTSSVAGLTLSKRLPDAASTSSPAMSMRTSPAPSWLVMLRPFLWTRRRPYEGPARTVKVAGAPEPAGTGRPRPSPAPGPPEPALRCSRLYPPRAQLQPRRRQGPVDENGADRGAGSGGSRAVAGGAGRSSTSWSAGPSGSRVTEGREASSSPMSRLAYSSVSGSAMPGRNSLARWLFSTVGARAP